MIEADEDSVGDDEKRERRLAGKKICEFTWWRADKRKLLAKVQVNILLD